MRTVAKRTKHSKRSTKPRPTVMAPFALTSDGQVLINVAFCDDHSIKKRAVFTGIPLSKNEARFAEERVDNAAADIAAKIAGMMPEGPGKLNLKPEVRKLVRQTLEETKRTTSPRKARRP